MWYQKIAENFGAEIASVFLCPRRSRRRHVRKSYAPQGIIATQSPRGTASKSPQPIGGGLHGAEPTTDPALYPAADNLPALARGGPPSPQHISNATFDTLKKPLAQSSCIGYNKLARQQKHKRQGEGDGSPQRPYAGDPVKAKSHTAEIICAQSPL